MKKEFTITERHNALKIRSEGQRYLRIFDAQGNLLLTQHGTDLLELEFLSSPGLLLLESDGEVLEAVPTSVEVFSIRSVEVLDYVPGATWASLRIQVDGLHYQQPVAELIAGKLLSLTEFKTALIAYFDRISLSLRQRLIPDYQMSYALLDVYDAATKAGIKTTVTKFHTESIKVEQQIKKARTLEQILAVRPAFPTTLPGRVIETDHEVTPTEPVAEKNPIRLPEPAKPETVKKTPRSPKKTQP